MQVLTKLQIVHERRARENQGKVEDISDCNWSFCWKADAVKRRGKAS